MALQITTAALAAKIRVSADPTTPPAEPELGIVEGLRSAADELINLYAPDAPDSIKDEAAVRFVGYLYDAPHAGAGVHVDAMRHSGAMSLLAWWRHDGADTVDGADITESATPETPLTPSNPVDPMNGGDMTPVDPNTLTSYFAAVDAPADTSTPEADVAALFTPAAFQAGTSFMGRDVEPPGNYDVQKVEGFAIHPDLSFTHVIASPNAIRQDVTSFYVRKSDVEFGGQTYRRYLAVRPGNWPTATPDFLPVFNLHFRLEDN